MGIVHGIDILSIEQDCRSCLPLVVSYSLSLTIFPYVQIAGTIGTGLFLGSGSALQGAGPLGALLAYLLVGTVAYSYVNLWPFWDPSLTRVQVVVFCR